MDSGAVEEQNKLEGELAPENQLAAGIQFAFCLFRNAPFPMLFTVVLRILRLLWFAMSWASALKTILPRSFGDLEAFLQSNVS
jgi:hypothetical protein